MARKRMAPAPPTQVRSAKTGRAYCRYPEQRRACAELGLTAGKLKLWLGCEYLRARDLRGGARPFKAQDLAVIQVEAPQTAVELLKRILSDNDVRKKQLKLFEGESK